MRIDRRLVLTGLLALGACASAEKPVFEPLDFDYLTKIKLDASQLDIEDAWVPRGSARHVEYLAPTRPLKALRLMADQRLVTGGMAGRAVFGVDDAALIYARGRFEGSFAVRLELFDGQGQSRGTVQARVRGARTARDVEDEDTTRVDLDTLVRKMMDDINVEFEFQLRQAFKDSLQTTAPAAPAPDAVETQELPSVPKQP